MAKAASMKALIVGLALASLTAVPAGAAAPAAPQQTSTSAQVAVTGWRLECDTTTSTLACRVDDRVVQASNGSLIVSLIVDQTPDGKTNLTMQTPLGVSVSTPIAVSPPSGSSQNFAFLTCSQHGCFATSPISASLLAAMESGQGEVKVTYTILDQSLAGHAITVSLPLTGFSQAFAKLKK
jgi:invasion protein IalB